MLSALPFRLELMILMVTLLPPVSLIKSHDVFPVSDWLLLLEKQVGSEAVLERSFLRLDSPPAVADELARLEGKKDRLLLGLHSTFRLARRHSTPAMIPTANTAKCVQSFIRC